MAILVTGGTGYIGSHTCVELLNEGYEVVIIDNLSNSSIEVIDRINKVTGKNVKFYEDDILNEITLRSIFENDNIDAVIHFAGFKSVNESVKNPLDYYHNNVTATLILCKVMTEYKVKNMVFSSSATVYGLPESVPITEDFPLKTTNPYGSTKLMLENILTDLYNSDNEWNISLLRYFNPIGAHKSGLIGEDPNGIPNNLLPYITQVAIGKREKLNIFGGDYDTKDGTGVRDYIHVLDLAQAHVKALNKDIKNLNIYNIGTGRGYSVIDLVKCFEKTTGKKVTYEITNRRIGDIAECYADPSKAEVELGWTAKNTIEDMCIDSWRWQISNPEGY